MKLKKRIRNSQIGLASCSSCGWWNDLSSKFGSTLFLEKLCENFQSTYKSVIASKQMSIRFRTGSLSIDLQSYVQTILFFMHFRFTFERMNENCCNVWLYTRNIREGKNEGRFFFVIKFTKDCHNFKRLLLISCAQEHINMVNQSVSLLFEP